MRDEVLSCLKKKKKGIFLAFQKRGDGASVVGAIGANASKSGRRPR